MTKQTYSVHLTRTVRWHGEEIVLDARASWRTKTGRSPEAVLALLRTQCRDELDLREREIAEERGSLPDDDEGGGGLRTPPPQQPSRHPRG